MRAARGGGCGWCVQDRRCCGCGRVLWLIAGCSWANRWLSCTSSCESPVPSCAPGSCGSFVQVCVRQRLARPGPNPSQTVTIQSPSTPAHPHQTICTSCHNMLAPSNRVAVQSWYPADGDAIAAFRVQVALPTKRRCCISYSSRRCGDEDVARGKQQYGALHQHACCSIAHGERHQRCPHGEGPLLAQFMHTRAQAGVSSFKL